MRVMAGGVARFVIKKLQLTISQRWDGSVVPVEDRVNVVMSYHPDGGLTMSIDAPWWSSVKPSQQVGRLAKLWEHDVVEVFLVGRDGRLSTDKTAVFAGLLTISADA